MLMRKRNINLDVKLPKAKKRSSRQIDDDSRNQRVKIHYIGHSSRYDEWRPLSDIVNKRTLVISEDSNSPRLHAKLT